MEDKINNALEALLYDIYTERGISLGDITTGQLKAWDDIVAKTAELFEQLIALNKEVD